MQINDIHLLINLQQLHHISKFYKNIDEYFSISAASIANKTLDSILKYYKDCDDVDNYESWIKWRELNPNREEYGVIRERVKAYDLPPESWSNEQVLSKQVEILLSFCSPFTISTEIERDLISHFPSR